MKTVDGTMLYRQAIQLIHDLRAENAALKEAIERLKRHVVDLDADFNSSEEHCAKHHVEGE